MKQYYGIEGGGTKFVCGVGSNPDDLHDRIVIPTTTPQETLPQVIEHIRAMQQRTTLAGIGVGIFGPLGLNPEYPHYGHITRSAKLAWHYTDIIGALEKATGLPVVFDTDVNAAALGEARWGNGKNISDFIYVTVGTGIGAGIIANHKLYHGALHPEMGHILIPKLANDTVKSVCAYHDSCLEGLACGPSMHARYNITNAMELKDDHPAWDMEAHYLATAVANYTFMLAPKRIIMGGGIMQQPTLLNKIKNKISSLTADYVEYPHLSDIDQYLVPPGLNNNAGLLGAIALAETYCNEKNIVGKKYVRPWGQYQTLAIDARYQIKTLTIEPQGQLSLQQHEHRAEHWIIIQGTPTITVGHCTKKYCRNQSVYIPQKTKHRIENFGDEVCVLAEIQIGDYLGEDDIRRFEDVYGRAVVTL